MIRWFAVIPRLPFFQPDLHQLICPETQGDFSSWPSFLTTRMLQSTWCIRNICHKNQIGQAKFNNFSFFLYFFFSFFSLLVQPKAYKIKRSKSGDPECPHHSNNWMNSLIFVMRLLSHVQQKLFIGMTIAGTIISTN